VDISSVVYNTPEPAYLCSTRGKVLAWNAAASSLVGFSESQAVGSYCYDLLRGTDMFGNRFCDKNCPIQKMALRLEKLHPFVLNVLSDSDEVINVRIFAFVLPYKSSGSKALLHILSREGDHHHDIATGTDKGLSPLTAREVEVLRLLALGMSTHQLSQRLFISQLTVRNHIQNILGKLDVHTRLAAVTLALKNHLI
jgi:DNA-binding CsgD family transcriptional regulator